METEQVKHPDPWQTIEYIDVRAKARELGCRVPVGIALMPGNFATATSVAEFRFHAAVPDIRSAWRDVGVIDSGLGRCQAADYEVAPDTPSPEVPLAVFIGLKLDNDPKAVLCALALVASVLTASPGLVGPREVRVEVIVERRSGGCACLKFRDFASNVVALAEPVQRVREAERDVSR